VTSDNDLIACRTIPCSGEALAVVGVGTWQTFDVGAGTGERDPLKEVLRTLVAQGARVLDSSPMYGRSEEVAGELSTELNLNERLFLATKVWTVGEDAGIRQMSDSFRLLRRRQIDLIQIHNLVDWQTHLKTLRRWKEQGKIRYVGITHYYDSAHAALSAVIKSQSVDFVQVNYNLANRNAERYLLPLAQEMNVAVLINRPFEEGYLFSRVRGRSLPEWAKDFDCLDWTQFFLKFILSHPAVTCVIPGTSRASHLLENLSAARGKLPTEDQRRNMTRYMSRL
jgi:diketogulonate reductase-like aldo/keto reductase